MTAVKAVLFQSVTAHIVKRVNRYVRKSKIILKARRIGTMQLNGLTRLLDTWAYRPVKLLYLLNARALPFTSKLSGSRQSKIINQGALVQSNSMD